MPVLILILQKSAEAGKFQVKRWINLKSGIVFHGAKLLQYF